MITETRVKDFPSLVGAFSAYENTVELLPPFRFRGQSNSAWGLLPSFAQVTAQRGFSRQEALDLEKHSLLHFIASIAPLADLREQIYLSPPGGDGNIAMLGWLMLMQHYGAPTRLLDWSHSPWIAVYFACHDDSVDGAVWIADFAAVVQAADKELGARNLYEMVVDVNADSLVHFISAHRNHERMNTQQGCFSVSTNPLSNHAECLDAMSLPNALTKIIIPARAKLRIMADLRRMNIGANSLFPGIDGVGKSIAEFCRVWRL